MLNKVENIAKEAGKILLKHYGDVKVKYKIGLDGRPATLSQADLESEQYITDEIRNHFPAYGISGEEQGKVNDKKDLVWHIDPLDGTQNFVRHISLFGISIGLTHKNKPILGVLHFPLLNLTVKAERGKGTYANNKKCKVSQRSLDKSLYYLAGFEGRWGRWYPKLANRVGWLKMIDSSAFELAQIAMGDAELYIFKEAQPYDVVAGIICVEEAGGRVTDGYGKEWRIGSKLVIASNGTIYEEVLRNLK